MQDIINYENDRENRNSEKRTPEYREREKKNKEAKHILKINHKLQLIII